MFDLYEPPICAVQNRIAEEITKNQEALLVATVVDRVGFDVDRERLIKALNFEKSIYDDVWEKAANHFRGTAHWIAEEDENWHGFVCDRCRRAVDKRECFCPNCGARMESEGQ